MKKSIVLLIAISLFFCSFGSPQSPPQSPQLPELSNLLEQRASERERLDSLLETTMSAGDAEFRGYGLKLDSLKEANSVLVKATLDSLLRFPRKAELSEAAMDELTRFMWASDPQFTLTYQPYLEAAFEQKEIKGKEYARIADKVLAFQGKPQRYGTFLHLDAKNILVGNSNEKNIWPIADMEKLDSLRATVDLEPFAAFLAKNGYSYSDDDMVLLAEIFPPNWNTVDADRIATQGWDKVLASLYADDQSVRKELVLAMMNGDKKRFSMLAIKMSSVDKVNFSYVEEYLRTRTEWPSTEELSEDARKGLFYVYQHAGKLSFYEQYYPWIQKAYEKGEIEGSEYAIATDRLLKYRGEPQIYGTQTANHDGTKVYKIKDFDNLDDLRKQVGIIPFKEYLELLKLTYEP